MKRLFAFALAAVMAVSMVACGGEEETGATYDVAEIAATIEATNPIRMAQPIDDDVMSILVGLTNEEYEAYAGVYCPITPGADIILAVQAKEGKIDAVKEAMENFKSEKIAANENYIGSILEKCKAARIVVKGNYAVLVIAGDDILVEDEGVEKAYEPVDAAIDEAFK